MSDLKIITNHAPRELVSFCDMPESARADFDYITGEDQYGPRFVKYRGAWHDVNEYMRVPASLDGLKGWDGYASDSYFSGTVIRYSDRDCESVIIGTYYS